MFLVIHGGTLQANIVRTANEVLKLDMITVDTTLKETIIDIIDVTLVNYIEKRDIYNISLIKIEVVYRGSTQGLTI